MSLKSAAEYRIEEQGGVKVFEVTPATVRKGKIALVVGALLILWGGIGVIGPARAGGEGVFIVLCGLGFLGFRRLDFRPRAHKQARTFRVSPEGVEADGRTFKAGEIHRLVISNGFAGRAAAPSTSEIVPVVRIGTAAGLGLAMRGRFAEGAYGVDLHAGGKAHMLAGGMDETTAQGLLTDVGKALGHAAA